MKRVEEEAHGYEQEYTQLTQSLIQVQIDLETAEREAMKQTEDLNHFGVKKQEAGKQIEFKRADRAASWSAWRSPRAIRRSSAPN